MKTEYISLYKGRGILLKLWSGKPAKDGSFLLPPTIEIQEVSSRNNERSYGNKVYLQVDSSGFEISAVLQNLLLKGREIYNKAKKSP